MATVSQTGPVRSFHFPERRIDPLLIAVFAEDLPPRCPATSMRFDIFCTEQPRARLFGN